MFHSGARACSIPGGKAASNVGGRIYASPWCASMSTLVAAEAFVCLCVCGYERKSRSCQMQVVNQQLLSSHTSRSQTVANHRWRNQLRRWIVRAASNLTRGLDTANRSHIRIRIALIFVHFKASGWPKRIFLLQNQLLLFVIGVYNRSQLFGWEHCGSTSGVLGWGCIWPSRVMPLSTLPRQIRSQSNHMSISRGPKNWGMLGPHLIGWGLADPRNVLFPHVCYCAKFGHSGSNSMSIHSEICQKNGPLASHLSRSLKLFGTDTDWSAAYFFLLAINGNHEPVSYHFQDNLHFWSKILNFPHRIYNPPLMEFALEFSLTALGSKKLPGVEKKVLLKLIVVFSGAAWKFSVTFYMPMWLFYLPILTVTLSTELCIVMRAFDISVTARV